MARGEEVAKRSGEEEVYLILTARALAKIFALYEGHVAPLWVWVDDVKEIGMRVEAGMAINADAYTLAGKGEGSDDDPFAAVGSSS